MSAPEQPMSKYNRMLAVLEGRKPDRYPFIGRLELWQRGLRYMNAMPEKYKDLALTDIHRDVGFGRHRMQDAYKKRYHGVEMVVFFNDVEVQRETDPLLIRMPDVRSVIPDAIGETRVEFRTKVGTLTVEYSALDSMLATGARAYMTKHPITELDDYPIVEYIIENTELVPDFETVYSMQREFGGDGWVVASMERVPFQQLLIDFIDTSEFFFVLHDNPKPIGRLLDLLGEQVIEAMKLMQEIDTPYVEIGDNVDGMMTNPRLFEKYSMEMYQTLSDMAHSHGKKIGSHMDGDLKPILPQIKECGLDVIESFSPVPLTPVRIEEVLELWGDSPIFWGGIPCIYLEEETPQQEFEDYIHYLLDTLNGRPAILNVVDMVLPINKIERVQRIAEIVEDYPL